jgi:hypothetical protein
VFRFRSIEEAGRPTRTGHQARGLILNPCVPGRRAGRGCRRRLQPYQYATLADYQDVTGQDRNSVMVDVDLFIDVPRLYRDPNIVQAREDRSAVDRRGQILNREESGRFRSDPP